MFVTRVWPADWGNFPIQNLQGGIRDGVNMNRRSGLGVGA